VGTSRCYSEAFLNVLLPAVMGVTPQVSRLQRVQGTAGFFHGVYGFQPTKHNGFGTITQFTFLVRHGYWLLATPEEVCPPHGTAP
jgi:hypothetical protein